MKFTHMSNMRYKGWCGNKFCIYDTGLNLHSVQEDQKRCCCIELEVNGEIPCPGCTLQKKTKKTFVVIMSYILLNICCNEVKWSDQIDQDVQCLWWWRGCWWGAGLTTSISYSWRPHPLLWTRTPLSEQQRRVQRLGTRWRGGEAESWQETDSIKADDYQKINPEKNGVELIWLELILTGSYEDKTNRLNRLKRKWATRLKLSVLSDLWMEFSSDLALRRPLTQPNKQVIVNINKPVILTSSKIISSNMVKQCFG